MIYKMSVKSLIESRKSSRTYIEKPVEQNKLQQIKQFLSDLPQAPFGSQISFDVVDFNSLSNNYLRSLGTYGFIKGARYFLIGTVTDEYNSLVDFGYLTEMVVLYLQELGLGSCWLGGSFKKSLFEEAIEMQPSGHIPAVISFGYAQQKQSFRESAIRAFAGSNKRKQWHKIFNLGNFDIPLSDDLSGKWKNSLEMLRIAPSASNKQPWRIVKDRKSDVFHFFLQRNRFYMWSLELLKLSDLQQVDMGIAMSHFELMAKEDNLIGTWETHEPHGLNTPENTEYIVSWNGKSE